LERIRQRQLADVRERRAVIVAKLDEAVVAGTMTQVEADVIAQDVQEHVALFEAGALSWVVILTIFMQILQVILDYFNNA
jgi:hypothetical protein